MKRGVFALGAGILAGMAAIAALVAVIGVFLFSSGTNPELTCATPVTPAATSQPTASSDTEPGDTDAIPSNLPPIYKAAGKEFHVPWWLLAGVNGVETDYGRNLNVSSAGAHGWMQFIEPTWNQYKVDGDHDGDYDWNDPTDAIFTAARYLRATGGNPWEIRRAIFGYNHANWYVDRVLRKAAPYRDGSFDTTGAISIGDSCEQADEGTTAIGNASVAAIKDAANALDNMHVRYNYGGGHITPAKPTGGQEGSYPGLDCSSSVSWVLQHAGLKLQTMVSGHGGFMDWGLPGQGEHVTIYAYSGHVIMKIDGRWFGTSGFGHPEAGTGPAWFTRPVPEYYLDLYGFVARHPPGL